MTTTTQTLEPELPDLPTLPNELLYLIGKYGIARSGGVSQPEVQHRWEQLIDGIKSYSSDYALDAVAADRGKREDWMVPQEVLTLLANLAAIVRVQNGNRYEDTNALLDHADRILSAAPVSAGLSDEVVIALAKERFGWASGLGGFNDAVKDFARALESRLSAAPLLPAQDWLPIETAPKDGTEVWAFNGEQLRMKWIEGDGYALWVHADDVLSDIDPNPGQPTHYRPLPPAPIAVPHPLAKQIANAQKEMSTWSDEKRASVQLEGCSQYIAVPAKEE